MPLKLKETTDCWDFLKKTDLPIFMYGMGLGAEKILSVFEQYGIACAGFFASDGFVRGHYFKEHLVHSLSEIEEQVPEFVVVLAFAAGYEELYDRIMDISKRHIVIAPDVPVAGEGLFTYEFFEAHRGEFEAVYERLADQSSRDCFENILNFKISGKPEYLDLCTTTREEIYESVIPLRDGEVFVDLGAYNGDTALEFASSCDAKGIKYKSIYAFEPNAKNYRKLNNNTSELHDITTFNACAWNECGELRFTKNEGRMSKASASGEVVIPSLAVDVAVEEQVTLIKFDVEGSEKEAIEGCSRQISNGANVICALYHRNEDMFAIPLQILALNPDCKIYVRHQLYIPAWETNLYVVSNK